MSHKEQQRKICRQLRKQRGLCYDCNNPANGSLYCSECVAIRNSRISLRRERQKQEVFTRYGGCCVVCGIDKPSCLTIDHITKCGGGQHRKNSDHGAGLYAKIVNDGFPPLYQILCWNCNYLKDRPIKVGKVGALSTRLRDRRALIIAAYGGQCRDCSYADTRVLVIDHATSSGNAHRRTLGNNYHAKLYRQIISEGFPPTYQILCWNCNNSKSL